MRIPTIARLKSDLSIPAMAVVVLAVTACVGSGSNSSALKPIDAGARVNVFIVEKKIDTATRVKVPIDDPLLQISGSRDTTDSIADEAVEGALVGAGTGVAMSLFCGSFFSSCAQVFVGPMTAAGATAGTMKSIAPAPVDFAPVEEAMIELSPRAADAFARAMAEMDVTELQNSVRDEFLRQSDDVWLITDEQPTVSITLGLESLYLSQLDDGKLFLITRTKILVENAAGRHGSNQEYVYSHTGDSRPTDEWFQDNGASLQSEVVLGIEKTVRQMLWALKPLRPVP